MIRAPPEEMSAIYRNIGYKEIDENIYKVAYHSAWPVQCMKAHDAEGRPLTYVGSHTRGDIVNDFFVDDNGCYWHESRAIVKGKIVSMDVYIFGHEVPGWNKRKS